MAAQHAVHAILIFHETGNGVVLADTSIFESIVITGVYIGRETDFVAGAVVLVHRRDANGLASTIHRWGADLVTT